MPWMTRRDVDKLQEEIEELFADLWQVPRFSGLRLGFRPNVDCLFRASTVRKRMKIPNGTNKRSFTVAARKRDFDNPDEFCART